MKKSTQRTIDPAKLSPGVRALNPHLNVPLSVTECIERTKALFVQKPTAVRKDKPDEEKMNKTELNWFRNMTRHNPHLKITPWPLRLRWGGAMHYTPDFGTQSSDRMAKMVLVEVKGAHIRSRDIVRFKGCREEWRHIFTFEMWQLVRGEWTQLL